MSTSSNDNTIDLGFKYNKNLDRGNEIKLCREEDKDFKKELIKVLKEISRRLYSIEVEIANK